MLNMSIMMYISNSTVGYLGMVVVNCLYPVIQRKSSASVVQGLKPANRTGKEKVQTTHQTALTVLPCECATMHGKHPRYFHLSSFSSNSTSSSSPGAVAHE